MKGKYLILVSGGILMLLVIISYTVWNRLDPVHTCAKCHEIAPSHTAWLSSAHADIQCIECHGTALSSFKEKTGMIRKHFSGRQYHEEIHLNEEQVVEITDRCIQCHQAEHAGWLASGHAVNYREIFMDADHNALEKPYWDCFRCHGMFYDGNINDLMYLDEDDPSSWIIKDKRQERRPAVPCMACHQMHTDNPVSKRYVSPADSGSDVSRNPRTALYVRADKMYLRSDLLTPVMMRDGDRQVNRATDPCTALCQQCHAPDYVHRAGSRDDRTPTGVHEGIGCTACHRMHSGSASESCILCHSDVSKNCKQDVRNMNTTFWSRNSPNDVHRINCVSCHEEKR